MQPQEDKKVRGVVTISNVAIGVVIAAIYLALTLLIPSQVRTVKNGLTNAQMYPYIVFICAAVLAVAFTLAFRKTSYQFDLLRHCDPHNREYNLCKYHQVLHSNI